MCVLFLCVKSMIMKIPMFPLQGAGDLQANMVSVALSFIVITYSLPMFYNTDFLLSFVSMMNHLNVHKLNY